MKKIFNSLTKNCRVKFTKKSRNSSSTSGRNTLSKFHCALVGFEGKQALERPTNVSRNAFIVGTKLRPTSSSLTDRHMKDKQHFVCSNLRFPPNHLFSDCPQIRRHAHSVTDVVTYFNGTFPGRTIPAASDSIEPLYCTIF
jgi:hypothetical protein